MAQRLELSRSGYLKYEGGKRFPSLDVLYLLVKEFNVSMDWLLFERGSMIFSHRLPNRELAVEKEKLEQEIATLKELHQKEIELLKVNQETSKEIKAIVEQMRRDPEFFHQAMAFLHKYQKENNVE